MAAIVWPPYFHAHTFRARDAHRKKQWTEVQQWCTRVIDIADDWNAIEQAHLRLALAEQKRTGVDGGRRAFQVTFQQFSGNTLCHRKACCLCSNTKVCFSLCEPVCWDSTGRHFFSTVSTDARHGRAGEESLQRSRHATTIAHTTGTLTRMEYSCLAIGTRSFFPWLRGNIAFGAMTQTHPTSPRC